MRRLPVITDSDFEGLLAGKGPADDDSSRVLACLVTDIRAAYPEVAPAPGVEARHVEAMVDTAQLLTDKGDPVARPASKAYGPDKQASGLPKLRRKTMLSTLFSTLAAKLAAGSLAGLTAMSGFAAARALPDPLQSSVSELAAKLGLELPDGTEVEVEMETDNSHLATEVDYADPEDDYLVPELDDDTAKGPGHSEQDAVAETETEAGEGAPDVEHESSHESEHGVDKPSEDESESDGESEAESEADDDEAKSGDEDGDESEADDDEAKSGDEDEDDDQDEDDDREEVEVGIEVEVESDDDNEDDDDD
jgi:hypothetical protein